MATLAIYPKPSFRLAIILISLHLMAIFSIYLLPLSEELKTLGVAALIISLIYYLRMNVLLTGANAIKILVLSDEAPCQLTLRSGESCICSVLEDSFVAPYLTVVNLKLEGKFLPQSLVIVVDSLDVEEFRQLRVWLRWNKIIIKKQKGEVN
ncbi:MAG: protein YgfX [Nitrosomonas sp.]